MTEEPATLMGHILQQKPWLVAWVFWLMAVNTASLFFVRRHVEARWVLFAWLVNFGLMSFLFEQVGFVRLLGLAHVVVWTPLLACLWRRRQDLERGSAFARWVGLLFLSNGASLAIDYVDVIRHLLGDGALT